MSAFGGAIGWLLNPQAIGLGDFYCTFLYERVISGITFSCSTLRCVCDRTVGVYLPAYGPRRLTHAAKRVDHSPFARFHAHARCVVRAAPHADIVNRGASCRYRTGRQFIEHVAP